MKKQRFTETQIVSILKQYDAGHQAAARSGTLYSLLGTCKMHGIEPYTWLKDVLQRIPKHPVNRIAELLPHHISQ